MTMERAAEIISVLIEMDKHDQAIDLFCHFEQLFNPSCSKQWQIDFAVMCGFGIAGEVRKL
jgi:hypothetical protein